jgi:CDP-diacylglycerol---glycerol-3-phosphate 3-phosphatidyltransferase
MCADSGIRHPSAPAGQALTEDRTNRSRYRWPTTDSTAQCLDLANGQPSSVWTARLRILFTRLLTPIGTRLVRLGVTPNVITVFGTIGVVGGAVVFYTRGWWLTGTLVCWGFVMLDALDGIVARLGGRTSQFGAVLDSTCDRFADAAVFGSLAWYFARHDQRWMLLAALLCLVLGAVTSYIRARAEAAGFTCNVGIAERTERLIIALVGTGLSGGPFDVPYVQAVALWLLVAASTITVGQRLGTVYRQSKELQAAQT